MRDRPWAVIYRWTNRHWSGQPIMRAHLQENTYSVKMKGIHQFLCLGVFGGNFYKKSFKVQSERQRVTESEGRNTAKDGVEQRSTKSYLVTLYEYKEEKKYWESWIRLKWMTIRVSRGTARTAVASHFLRLMKWWFLYSLTSLPTGVTLMCVAFT